MGKKLGLDLGPNSIGWGLVTFENDNFQQIDGAGSRIIPFDAAKLGNYEKGNSVSQTAECRSFRSARRMRERILSRRYRMHRILNLLGFLPPHYANEIDFDKHLGAFLPDTEPKLAWAKNKDGRYEFLFMQAFKEMLVDFHNNQPEMFNKKLNGKEKLIPYDWTIYYLRKKALTRKIDKFELVWILLQFNTKRGYYQLRNDEETKNNKQEEYYKLKVISVEATDQKRGKDIWYDIHFENGMKYSRASSVPLDWVDKTKEFIVTTELEKDGSFKKNKDGEIKRSFRVPTENDWLLMKVRTEKEISDARRTVGEFIYDELLKAPDTKIKGKLISTIERDYYKEELHRIIETQMKFHDELRSNSLYSKAISELYRQNEAYRKSIANKDFHYLLMDDILYYQRPLKIKKSLVSDCKFEVNFYKDKEGNLCESPLKVTPRSHPLYQEFRLWKFISQVSIMDNDDNNITDKYLKRDEDYVQLFQYLNSKKVVTNEVFLKNPGFKIPRKDIHLYRWNYPVDKEYPCNETKYRINSRLEKFGLPVDQYDIMQLWHILYSVGDSKEIKKALAKYAVACGYDPEKFVEALSNVVFETQYGAYSEKALKKLLPLMRRGEYWDSDNIDSKTMKRIDNIINGVFDQNIDDRTREKCNHLTDMNLFSGLPEWLAGYVVYGRHAEVKYNDRWETPADIDIFLKNFKQHSMHNPIVEQVVMESLRTVRDIWSEYGNIDEIHVELGRDMKRTKEERQKDSKQNIENENANIRIRRLLEELKEEYDYVKPYSLVQQDKMKIYETTVINSVTEIPEDISFIRKKMSERDENKQPSKSEIDRYKLWLEQKYRSPYTGEIIPLGRLFTSDYQIEHIIPQSRYFDNSFNNKVICEAEVNRIKDKRLAMEFIKNPPVKKITLSGGKVVTILDTDSYTDLVNKCYANSNKKKQNLLLEDIPEKFTARQMNDTRYISRFVCTLLSNIIREENEPESVSKNIIMTNGSITDRLKKDWGLNDIWNTIITPRFQRLNEKDGSNRFGYWECAAGKRFFRTQMPSDLMPGFNKKRIDHRHHAMDAIVIACTTRSHINYLNNVAANNDAIREDLKHKLCFKDKSASDSFNWKFKKPWETFTQDTFAVLTDIVASIKKNNRVINKSTNLYLKYKDGKKKLVVQEGPNWVVRKSMHKDTVHGHVNLRSVKDAVDISKAIDEYQMLVDKKLKKQIKQLLEQGLNKKQIIKILRDNHITHADMYYFSDSGKVPLGATRKNIDTEFDAKKINKITDSGIRKIMFAHLEKCGNDSKLAFSAEGVEDMNKNIVELNNGKLHKPIYKVRVSETILTKFNVGSRGNKSAKFVEADKGTNLFFGVYADEKGKRSYFSVPLNEVIDRQKNGLASVPETLNGNKLMFVISPNDLVYVPNPDQLDIPINIEDIDRTRIYKMVSSSGSQCFFVPVNVAYRIVEALELGSSNKAERAFSGEMIKEICVPVYINRLGRISLTKS